MRDVVIVEAGRSPIGRRGGSFATSHPADVLGPVQMEVLRRAQVESSDVGQVVGGCISKVGAQAMNITRTAWLSYGGATEIACTTVDSQCGSSQYAVNLGSALVASGEENVVLACGVELMSRLPIGSDAVAGTKAGMGKPISRSYYDHYEFISQFAGAERVAEKYGITRSDTDALGLESQLRAARAIAEGRFEEQVISIGVDVRDEQGARSGATATVTADEIPRHTSMEALACLQPVLPNGLHTAGTSAQIADGAAAVLLMSAEEAQRRGLQPLARVVGTALVGSDPVLMLEGPIPATQKLLADAGLTIDDIDVFEINEAFASVVLAWVKAVNPDMERVNPNGGAIALGHPLGGTGTVLIAKALHELHRGGGRYGLVSMCWGGGLGTGTLLER